MKEGVAKLLAEELESLRTLRDELRVKVQLGKQEVRDRWEQTEKSWHDLEAKLDRIERESKQSLENVEEAARNLLKEVREGYRRIKDRL